RANDKIAVGMYRPLLPHHPRPPMADVRVGCQCMTHPNHITTVLIQPPIRMVGHRNTRQGLASFQLEWVFVGKIIHAAVTVSMQNKRLIYTGNALQKKIWHFRQFSNDCLSDEPPPAALP